MKIYFKNERLSALGCRQEVHHDFLFDEKASGQWIYQKTGKKSGLVYGKLIVQGRNFKKIPCPDRCFDLILVNGFPLESFFYSRLFTELSRLLHPQGKLCFNLTSQTPNTYPGKTDFMVKGIPNVTRMKETIIYYGMNNGFTFTEKEFSAGKHRMFTKNPCYSLHLTLTNPAVPRTLTPMYPKAKKSRPSLLWFIKEPNPLNSEEYLASES